MALQNPYYPQSTPQTNVITLTAASTGVASPVYTMGGNYALQVYINVSALTGTSPTLTVTIQGYDPTSGTYFTVLASTAIAATGFTVLTVATGTTAAANSVANSIMPQQFRINTTIGGTTPAVTATIGFCTVAG